MSTSLVKSKYLSKTLSDLIPVGCGLIAGKCMHELVGEIAEQKLLVAFQTDTRCKVIKVFFIGYWTALVDTSDVELLREV